MITLVEPGQRINEALAKLGATCEEVAERLRMLGIKGKPGEAFACPIRNYVLHCEIPVRGVTPDYVRDGKGREHPVPPPVHEFIGAFDQGRYPELVEAEP